MKKEPIPPPLPDVAAEEAPVDAGAEQDVPPATVQEGATIPSVVFKCRIRDESIGGENPFTWKDVSTADLFKGRRSVIFALPGAFTPTCSSVSVSMYRTPVAHTAKSSCEGYF